MRSALVGAALLALGVLAIVTGLLPMPDAMELVARVLPVLAFVVAITVVTELAAESGLFTAVASRLARWGGGRTLVLWVLVSALAIVTTVFLSLDTTAVLLTPVVIALARHVGARPLPFALTTVWLANTASLLLPVSNLTNLLAQHQLGGIAPLDFAHVMLLPAAVAIVIPLALLLVLHRRDLTGRYRPEDETPASDAVLLRSSAVTVALLVPALVSGIEVWIPASVAALVLSLVFLVRRPAALRPGLIPWSLLLLASGLFLVIEAAHGLGLDAALTAAIPDGSAAPGLLGTAGAGLVAANLANNLPAYLALEPAAGESSRLFALLIGVNAGPLITPWASLATLLWAERLRAQSVPLSWGRFALLGLVVAPLTVGAATLALALTTR